MDFYCRKLELLLKEMQLNFTANPLLLNNQAIEVLEWSNQILITQHQKIYNGDSCREVKIYHEMEAGLLSLSTEINSFSRSLFLVKFDNVLKALQCFLEIVKCNSLPDGFSSNISAG